MPSGLGFGLFASLLWGVAEIAGALSTRMVGSLRVLVGSQAVSVVVLGAIVLVRPDLLGPDPLAGMLAAFPVGLLASVVYLAYYTALRIGPVSIVSPVIVAYGGAAVVLAVIVRGETLLPAQAAGAAIATAGVVLASVSFGHDDGGAGVGAGTGVGVAAGGGGRRLRVLGPGVAMSIVTLIGFAMLAVLLAGPIKEHGWLPSAIGSRIGNNLASLVILAVALRSRSRRFSPLLLPWEGWSRRVILLILAAGAFDIVGFVSFAMGLEVAPAWLIGLSSSFGPVLALVWAVVGLGERPQRSQWVGLCGILVGVVVLALAV
jgi:drug/metabolite transporter (DMT)-like permease